MPFTAKEPVQVDSTPVPSPTPAPTPAPTSDKKPDNIIPFVAKEPVAEQKVQSANPDPTSDVIAHPESPLTDTESQAANPDPTLSKPDTDQTSNEVGFGGAAPEIAPQPTQWSDTPTGQSLITKVQNPLGLPPDVAAKLINDAVAPRMPNSNPEIPDYPMGSGKPPPSRALGFVAKEPVQVSQPSGFVAKEPVQGAVASAPTTPQNQGPELIGQEDWKKWDEQIKPYDDDPDKIAKSGIPDIKERLKLMLYAQTKKDMRESGFQYDQLQKNIDDANNAVKTVGGWIAGAKATYHDVLQIPSQISGTLGNAIEAGGAAHREGSNPLQPPKETIPSEMGVGAGNIPANTPLTSGDIYTGGIGTQPSDEVIQQRSDQAKRALVAGVEEGAASNIEFAENVASGLIGLTSTAPNAVMKLFGGPQVGYIDPKVQTWLATLPNPVPILSGKGWDSMDAPEMLSNLVAQDVQNNIHSARSSGNLDKHSEELLKTWAGHTVNTPESAARNGFPTPLKAIQDTAGVTNLLMGYPEFGLWGRFAEAAGLNNIVGLMTKKTLQRGAELAEGVAEKTDLSGNLKAIRLRDQAIKDMALTGETAVKAAEKVPVPAEPKLPSKFSNIGRQVVDQALGTAIGLGAGHAAGLPLPISIAFAPIMSQVLKVPIKVAGALAKGGMGYASKVTSALADETADALRLMAEDSGNLLATRSPLKQFLVQTSKNIAEGAGTMLIPAALGSKSPEEFGSLMTMGAGMGLVGHALPDLVKGLQTQLIDRTFITDNNRYRSRTLAPDPMAYGTNPYLDAQTKISMNSADPATGNPVFNNSKRHVLNDLQSHYAPMAEIHVLNPKPYAAEVQRMADLGHIGNDPQLNSYGVTIDPNPGINKARILIRSDHFDDAIHHELGHAITNRMTPDDLRTAFLAYSKTNDPNEFTQNYTQRAKPGSAGITYDQLPTEEGLKAGQEKHVPGFEGMTKDDMEKEMASEAVSGLLKGGSIRDLTRDPTMAHNMQQVFWRILDDLGFDPVTTRTISPLGLNQSIPSAMVLEPILRDTLKSNRGAAQGALSIADKKRPSPLGTVNPDESTIQALMKKGFDRQQAEDFIAENKQQSVTGPATTESLQIAQVSPAQRARNILRGDHKFSAEDAKKYVPDDAKVASEAVMNALESKAKETGGTEPKNADELGKKLTGIEKEIGVGKGAEEKPFVPSKDWQEQPDWALVPSHVGGFDRRRNSSGKVEVKWSNPPPQEEVTDKRTGKAQKNAAGEEVVPKSESKPKPPEPPEAAGEPAKKPKKPRPPKGTAPPAIPGTPPAPASQPPPAPPITPEAPQSPEKPKEIVTPAPEEPPLETTPENVENIQALQKEEGLKPGPAQRVVTGKGKKAPKRNSKGQARNKVPFESAKQRAIDELQPKDRSDWDSWNKQGKIKQGEPSEAFKRGNEVNDRVMARAAQIQDEVAKGQSQQGSLHPNQGPIPEQTGTEGYYGYVGDASWDDASGMGIGGFPFSNHKGFLIPDYSAALKKSSAARRGILPGQEFRINGHLLRYDDVIPEWSPVGHDYVDVYCYSSDTQILTRRGWSFFNDLLPSDEVATRNCDTKAFEWQIPTDWVNVPFSGNMIHFKSRVLDLLVTPDHRVLIKSRTTGKERILTASAYQKIGTPNFGIPSTSTWSGVAVKEITFSIKSSRLSFHGNPRSDNKSGHRGVCWDKSKNRWLVNIKALGKNIYLGSFKDLKIAIQERIKAEVKYGEYEAPAIDKPTRISGDDFCALMGAYIAEGNIRSQGGIEIAQRPESKGFKTYKELMERVFGSCCHTGRAFAIGRKPLSDYCRQFGLAHQKFIPQEIMEATSDQIRLFLHYYILGDGCSKSTSKLRDTTGYRKIRMDTVSSRLADQLVELWQKVGYSASVKEKRGGSFYIGGNTKRMCECRTGYHVSVKFRESISFNSASTIQYSGTVHCVTVPNGIVYVRRNGKPAWCGNSPRQPPDRGVSPEKIAYQARIAAGRPGNTGQMGAMSPGESIVAQSLGGKPGPPQPPSPKAPEAPKEEAKVEAPIGITSGEVNAAEQQAQESVKKGNKSEEAYREAINAKVIEQIGPKHAETLKPDDERVKFDPESGWMTGKYFDPNNDAFHQWLLRNQSPEVLSTLQKIESAIADKKDLFVDYKSAPQKEKGLPTAEQREKAQKESTPSDRDKGLAMIQQAGKNVLPSFVGMSKEGNLFYGGVAPDKIASNAAQIQYRLGPESPYKLGPLGSDKVAKVANMDLHNYLNNQNNGWKGDGSAKLKTVKGGTQVPEESEEFVPYEMPAIKGNFWNLAIAGKDSALSKGSMNKGQSTSSGRAAELALLNRGMATKEGFVNPLHQKIESETPGWTEKHLHSGYELLRVSLTKAIHPSGEIPSEPIHPGHEEMAKAMTEKGLPKSQQVKAGFMPGKEIVSPNVKEGTDFDYARTAIFAPQHQEAKHYAKQVESAISKAYGYKPGELHDSFGDWGDGAENSIVSKTTDQPFNVIKLKTALKGLHSAQKQAIAWEDHPAGDHVMYEMNFHKTAPEVRDIMQAHGLTYKTIIADTKHGEPTTAYVLDTDGSAGQGVAQLAHTPIKQTGLESYVGNVGHGEFLGDPAGSSRDDAARNFRSIIEEGLGEGRHPTGKGLEHLRDLATQAEHVNARLKSESGKANWMPGDVIEHPETGEREVIQSAALRIGDRIFVGPAHVFAHMNAEEELGRHVKKGEAEEGFMTKPTEAFPQGRFIDRMAAWQLAKKNKQAAEGAKPLEEMKLYKGQKTMTGGKMEGLRSEDLTEPGANYMPGDRIYETPQGNTIRETSDLKAEPLPGQWMIYRQNGKKEEKESKNGVHNITAREFHKRYGVRLSSDLNKSLHPHSIMLGPAYNAVHSR